MRTVGDLHFIVSPAMKCKSLSAILSLLIYSIVQVSVADKPQELQNEDDASFNNAMANMDPLAGLNRNSPEILVRDARRMQTRADSYLEPEFAEQYMGQYPTHEPLNLLFGVAISAANDPEQLDDAEVVRRWSQWWAKSEPRNPYDTRTDA